MPKINSLGEHFIIEDKVIGVRVQRQRLQYFSIKRTITGVIFGELVVQQEILDQRQYTIRDVLVQRHSAAQGTNAENARTKRYIVFAGRNEAGKRSDQSR